MLSVFRSSVIFVLGLTASLGLSLAAAPGARAQEQLAASCTATTEVPAGGGGTDQALAQVFTASLTGQLTRAELDVIGDDVTDDDYVVQIRSVQLSDSPGFESELAPTSAVLASTALPEVPTGVVQTLNAVFPNPPTVTAGQSYALAVVRDEALFTSNQTGDCPHRAWRSQDAGDTWQPFGFPIDFAYRAYVVPPAQSAAQLPPGANSPAGSPSCERLQTLLAKRKRQRRHAKRAGNQRKLSFIKHNIRDTRRRMRGLGC